MRRPHQDRAAVRQTVGLPWRCMKGRHPAPISRTCSLTAIADNRPSSAEDWTRSFSASSVLKSHRSPILHAPGRQGRALFVGEDSCLYSLHRRESVHYTTCQAQFLSCRRAPRMPPCSPTPIFPGPSTYRSRLEYASHEWRLTMLQIPTQPVGVSPCD